MSAAAVPLPRDHFLSAPTRWLGSVQEVEPLLRDLINRGFSGEVRLSAHSRAQICLYQGAVAWVRLENYPEHLGDVLRRELGIPHVVLRRAMEQCRHTKKRFGEGLVEQGLVRPEELRQALYLHIHDQLLELFSWAGPVTELHCELPHRYDPAFTFSLDELLRSPLLPSPSQKLWLRQVADGCWRRLPELSMVCMAETEEGRLLCNDDEEADPSAEDLISLCLCGLHRLANNRITRDDGMPKGLILHNQDGTLLAQPLPEHPRWLLLLAGPASAGQLISVAHASIRDAGPLDP